MHPHLKSCSNFNCPTGGLLEVWAYVKYDELRRSTMLDAGEDCRIVTENGAATGVTLGHATGIDPFVRVYKNYGIKSTSLEIAMYPSHQDGAFCAAGTLGLLLSIVTLVSSACSLAVPARLMSRKSAMRRYCFLNNCIKVVFPSFQVYPIA